MKQNHDRPPEKGRASDRGLLPASGLRQKEKAIRPGAQTERRGEAGPVRLLLGGGTHRPLLLLLG
jgi:hypothetical protein